VGDRPIVRAYLVNPISIKQSSTVLLWPGRRSLLPMSNEVEKVVKDLVVVGASL
jgi:hypothetical protein